MSDEYGVAPRAFTLRQRLLIALASYLGYFLVLIIGRTLRWTTRGWEHWQSLEKTGTPAIMAVWHTCILPGVWFWRRRGIVAMTSQHFDGEYIARILSRHGYITARGSSSRGGMQALGEMQQYLKQGRPVVFTIDGPRGPRYQAKIGPVLLAQRTGLPILCFHVSLKNKIQLKSWDEFKIPFFFTPALMQIAPPIYIAGNARRAQVLETHAEMQRTLDRLRETGDSFWR